MNKKSAKGGDGEYTSGVANDRIKNWDCLSATVHNPEDWHAEPLNDLPDRFSNAADSDDCGSASRLMSPSSSSLKNSRTGEEASPPTEKSRAARDAGHSEGNALNNLEPRQNKTGRMQEQTNRTSERSKQVGIESDGSDWKRRFNGSGTPVAGGIPSVMDDVPSKEFSGNTPGKTGKLDSNLRASEDTKCLLSESFGHTQQQSGKKSMEKKRVQIPTFLDPSEDMGGHGTRNRTAASKTFSCAVYCTFWTAFYASYVADHSIIHHQPNTCYFSPLDLFMMINDCFGQAT
jgi:hypothetical protein